MFRFFSGSQGLIGSNIAGMGSIVDILYQKVTYLMTEWLYITVVVVYNAKFFITRQPFDKISRIYPRGFLNLQLCSPAKYFFHP